MKKQVIVIGGGEAFDTYEKYLEFLCNYKIEDLNYFKKDKWKNSLQEKLGNNFDVIIPQMPNSLNSKYLEWKIWFDKIVLLLNDEIILIGYSLGGIFLIKYLSENVINKKVLAIFIVAGPHDTENSYDSLADFVLNEDLSNVEKQSDVLNFYHSKDDPIVPYLQFEKFQKIFPNANFHSFEDRGHFNQPEFPELVNDILKL